MKRVFCFLIIQSFLLQLLAQNVPDVRLSRLSILIGESFDVELQADSTNDAPKPIWIFPGQMEHFEYISIDSSKPYRCILRLTSWDTGFWKPEPITVLFSSAQQSPPLKITIPSVRVHYASYSDKNPDDIKPIIQPEQPPLQWPRYLLIAVIVSASLFFTYRYFSRKQKQPGITTPTRKVRTSAEIRQLMSRYEQELLTNPAIQKKAFIEIRTSLLQLLPLQQQRLLESKPFRAWMQHQQSWLNKNVFDELSSAVEATNLVIYGNDTAETETCKQVIRAFKSYLDAWDKNQSKTP